MSNQLTVQPLSVSDMERMATSIAKSGLFGMKTVDQALALMVVAAAEGKHPGSVAAEYHIIQGKASLKADAMLARFQQAGGKVEWHDHTDTKVSATFSHSQGGSLRIDWDLARAKAAGLGGKDNWAKYPRQMLRARVISEGVRAVFPAVLQGMYTPEEVIDFTTAPASAPAAVKAPAVPVEAQEEPQVIEAELVEDEPSDWAAPLEAAFKTHEEAINAFLQKKEQIGLSETWRDLPEGAYRKRIVAAPDKFVAAVSKEGASK
jgi:hypothetical protein